MQKVRATFFLQGLQLLRFRKPRPFQLGSRFYCLHWCNSDSGCIGRTGTEQKRMQTLQMHDLYPRLLGVLDHLPLDGLSRK